MPKGPTARERILETACELFYQRGYKEVGINEIIEKSGTAKATFYSNFKSKEALGEAWLQQVHDFSESQRTDVLKGLTDPLKVIERYFKNLEKFLKSGHFRGCPYTNTAAVLNHEEVALRTQVEEHKESIRQFFRGLASHSLKPRRKADLLGDQIFLLYSGATTESQNLQTTWPVTAALKASQILWQEAHTD